MSHYLYRPHIHGPEHITTPDILVDRLFRACLKEGAVILHPAGLDGIRTNPEVPGIHGNAVLIPAVYLVAAGGGIVLSAGAECVVNEYRLLHISRFAWRLKYVEDRLDRVQLLVSREGADPDIIPLNRFPAPEAVLQHLGSRGSALPRGFMVSATAAEVEYGVEVPGALTLSLMDNESERHFNHTISFTSPDGEGGVRPPDPRYAVGPQTGDVTHYI